MGDSCIVGVIGVIQCIIAQLTMSHGVIPYGYWVGLFRDYNGSFNVSRLIIFYLMISSARYIYDK